MPAPCPIPAIGLILSRAGDRTYRTSLPNGKEIIAHVRPRLHETLGPLVEGSRVRLEMTSWDFSTGRIAGLADGPLPP